MTTVAVCVPWRTDGCEHREAAWEWVRRRWTTLHPRWPIITGSCTGPWNVASALNDAIAQADADVVVVTGADCVLSHMDVTAAVNFAGLGRWVMAAGELFRPSQQTTAKILACKPTQQLSPPRLPGERRRTRLGWGPIIAPLDLIRSVGGWDERFTAWFEDDAFGLAARQLAGPPHRMPGEACLLWHPRVDRRRMPDYRANVELWRRYKTADADGIRALIAERSQEEVMSWARPG